MGVVVRDLAGRAGARVLAGLGVAVSRQTALRALVSVPLPIRPVPTQGRVESDRPAISPRRLARYLPTRPDRLKDHQRERLDAAVAACPEMTALAGLVGDFAALLAPTTGNDMRLTGWIELARTEDLPHLHAFTRGLQLDRRAVNAAITYPFRNGRTEGVNTKTKLIKRQMYGRAAFPLLRHRILLG